MTQLDEALVALRQDMNDSSLQTTYYDLFLNTVFVVPTVEDDLPASASHSADGALPLVIEAEGAEYLMLFDSRDRLFAWAGAEVPFVEVPGHFLAAGTTEPLHWALNVGTEYSKRFLPAEIAWLREAVQRCDLEASFAEMLGKAPAP